MRIVPQNDVPRMENIVLGMVHNLKPWYIILSKELVYNIIYLMKCTETMTNLTLAEYKYAIIHFVTVSPGQKYWITPAGLYINDTHLMSLPVLVDGDNTTCLDMPSQHLTTQLILLPSLGQRISLDVTLIGQNMRCGWPNLWMFTSNDTAMYGHFSGKFKACTVHYPSSESPCHMTCPCDGCKYIYVKIVRLQNEPDPVFCEMIFY